MTNFLWSFRLRISISFKVKIFKKIFLFWSMSAYLNNNNINKLLIAYSWFIRSFFGESWLFNNNMERNFQRKFSLEKND